MKKLMMLAALLAMALVAAAPALAQVVEEFEIEEAESGDAEPEVAIANRGDSVNQCVALLQSTNTGNVQNVQGVNQYGVRESDDLEFEGSGIEISPELEQECEQVIQQAAAAGPKGEAKAGKAEAKAGEAVAKAAPAEAKAAPAEAKAAPAEAKADAGGGGGGGGGGAAAKELPKTGGVTGSASLLALGVAGLLIGGGLIARRFTR